MNLRIDPDRFLADLHHLRSIGAAGVGKGVVRPAFSEADLAARAWTQEQLGRAGLAPQIDPMGNVWGLSRQTGGLLLGSHTDTQPEGGWLDGALGVIAALEVARAAQEAGRDDISVVSFQDEEGRFGGLTGSTIWSGQLAQQDADLILDGDGTSLAEARQAVQSANPSPAPERFRGFLELHIEQGPVLESAKQTLGVVTALVGAREINVTLTGQQNHAGTTPMAQRRDALRGLTAVDTRLAERLLVLATPETVWTIGRVELHPNAASIVPGRVRFTVQWRDASADRLADMEEVIRETIAEVAAALGLGADVRPAWAIPPRPMDDRLVTALAEGAEATAPGNWRRMTSGALHDAANVSHLMPAAMLFVPSIGGISHNFAENTSEDDLVAGVTALAAAVSVL